LPAQRGEVEPDCQRPRQASVPAGVAITVVSTAAAREVQVASIQAFETMAGCNGLCNKRLCLGTLRRSPYVDSGM